MKTRARQRSRTSFTWLAFMLGVAACQPASADHGQEVPSAPADDDTAVAQHDARDDQHADRAVSPVRRIRRSGHRLPARPGLPRSFPYRNIDGSNNNRKHPSMGRAGTPLLRLIPPDYGDGVDTLAGAQRPGPRTVSNEVSAWNGALPNALDASDYLWQWGQFLDHDIDLTDGVDPPEPAPIPVPLGDPHFDPQHTGSAVIAFNRSLYDPASGWHPDNPRQQINEISAWIDASNVYGSSRHRALALRTLDGTGRLLTSPGNLLPFNESGLPNAGGSGAGLFVAGDVRANENVGLTALHTLFVREHNRYADALRAREPHQSGEAIYQSARRYVGALMQVITYEEYLPALLGPEALAPYSGYRMEVDASISNLFSTAAYRYGHSALSPTLLRVDARGHPIEAGHLPLRDAFFAPQRIIDEGGIEPILRGLSLQRCERIDPYVIDDVRNFLFGPPSAGGFDLAALNIQRGRDHGLPSYNAVREALGLGRKRTFEEISDDVEMQRRLAQTYTGIDDVDIWVGALAESPLPGTMVGELIYEVIREQFEALRDGDRFWYERSFSRKEVRRLKRTRLSDVIRRNTVIGSELDDDVFHVVSP